MPIKNRQLYITPQTKILHQALVKRGINAIMEYSDGHKHVDLAILDARIFIEIDGLHHYTNPKQIESDFKRTYYSNDNDFDTIHIPNIVLEKCLNGVVKALVVVIKKRKFKNDM